MPTSQASFEGTPRSKMLVRPHWSALCPDTSPLSILLVLLSLSVLSRVSSTPAVCVLGGLFIETGSHIFQAWLKTCCVAEHDLEPLISLPLPPKSWDYRCALPCQALLAPCPSPPPSGLEVNPGQSFLLGVT